MVGETPAEIRVSREQYIDLLRQIDAGTRSHSPIQAELAYELLATVRSWFPQGKVSGQVDGQLELPLEWAESGAGR